MSLLSTNADRRCPMDIFFPTQTLCLFRAFAPRLMPVLCLLPKPRADGGRGPQVHDAPGPLRLFTAARPQQLGALPSRAPLEPQCCHGPPGHTGREPARQEASKCMGPICSAKTLLWWPRPPSGCRGSKSGETTATRPRLRRVSDRPSREPGGAHQPVGIEVAVSAPGYVVGPRAQGRSAMDGR